MGFEKLEYTNIKYIKLVRQKEEESENWIFQRLDSSVVSSWAGPAYGSFLLSCFLASLDPTNALSLPFRERPPAFIETNQSS